jgi:hypothetical protein
MRSASSSSIMFGCTSMPDTPVGLDGPRTSLPRHNSLVKSYKELDLAPKSVVSPPMYPIITHCVARTYIFRTGGTFLKPTVILLYSEDPAQQPNPNYGTLPRIYSRTIINFALQMRNSTSTRLLPCSSKTTIRLLSSSTVCVLSFQVYALSSQSFHFVRVSLWSNWYPYR